MSGSLVPNIGRRTQHRIMHMIPPWMVCHSPQLCCPNVCWRSLCLHCASWQAQCFHSPDCAWIHLFHWIFFYCWLWPILIWWQAWMCPLQPSCFKSPCCHSQRGVITSAYISAYRGKNVNFRGKNFRGKGSRLRGIQRYYTEYSFIDRYIRCIIFFVRWSCPIFYGCHRPAYVWRIQGG